MSSSRRLFLALLVLLVAARGALVLSLGDVFFYGEELEKGTAGKAMIDGLGVDHRALAYHAYEGGGFVVSHLDALAFLAAGENVLALKLVALAFDAAILAAGVAFCARAFGGASAAVFGLLFAFAPESFQKISLLALGIHFEATLFILLILHLAGRILFESSSHPRTWLWLGLSAGFGIYFSYQCVLPVGLAALALLVHRKADLASAKALGGLAGFALGILPLLAMAQYAGSAVLDIHGADPLASAKGSRAELLGAFLSSVYGGRSALDLAALLLIALAPLTALAARGPWTWLVAAYLAVFAAAYLFSGFVVGAVHHYFLFERLSPLFLGWLLLTSAGVSALIARAGRARIVGWAVLGVLVVSGAADTVAIASAGRPSSLARNWHSLTEVKGYQYVGYLKKLASRMPRETFAFDERDPALLRASIASDVWSERAESLADVERRTAGMPADERRDFYLGLGPWWWGRHGESLATAVVAVADAPEDVRPWIYEAIGRYGASWLVTEVRLQREIDQALASGWPDDVLRGQGYRLQNVRGIRPLDVYHRRGHTPWQLDPDAALAFLERQDPRIRSLLREGYELAVSERELD